ncbi:MAG: HAD-IC family P-type ATPase, partial [Candidatus Saccharimonadaceae bacterium]
MSFYQKSPRQTLEVLEATEAGLSSLQAKHRLDTYGPNAIIVQGEPIWRRLVEPFANLMMGVLSIAVIISLMHHALFDAIVILAIMLVSATIFYVQRFSTERILKSLQQKSSVKVDVLRDGKTIQLAAEKLVPGDIILIDEGEKIPADARLISSSSLRIDESQITGESMPVDKSIDELDGEREIYDQTCMVFQGSFVVSGEATAVVVATGNKTEFGKLAELSSQA